MSSELDDFLNRTVGDGAYFAVTAKSGSGMVAAFYMRERPSDASEFIAKHVGLNHDVYFALAGFREPGKRTQENAQGLRAFWFDADVLRPGDGKDPSKAHASQAEVFDWVAQFCRETKLPMPAQWVSSGYGVHVYWLLERSLDRASWQPRAEALKGLLISHRAKGDASITTDSARILRPPGTFNFKSPGQPVACYTLLSRPLACSDADLLAAFDAHAPIKPNGHDRTGLSGQPPKIFGAGSTTTTMTAAARQNIERRPHDFSLIAERCLQVKKSVEEGGATDDYTLWYPLVTLAWFCGDSGREWAHVIGEKHKDYTEASTNAAFERVGFEHAKKDFGATTCRLLNAVRPGVCDGCLYKEKLNDPHGTPFSLGLIEQTADGAVEEGDEPVVLPPGYYRGWSKHAKPQPQIERINSKNVRVPVVSGGFANMRLYEVEGHHRVCFTYHSLQGRPIKVYGDSDLEPRDVKRFFARQGIPLAMDAKPFGDLIVAWIKQLLDTTDPQLVFPAKPYGWTIKNDQLHGLSIANICYGVDGSEQFVGGGDRITASWYQPRGKLELWREAAERVIDGVPEHMLSVCVAFGAPLMQFLNVAASCFNFVGPSGRGKSSALKAQAAVYGHPLRTMSQLDDTHNSFIQRMNNIQSFPAAFDDLKIDDKKFTAIQLDSMLMGLSLGRGKERLDQQSNMRPVGDWYTLVAIATNQPLAEVIAGMSGDHTATLLRMLEIKVDHKRAVDHDSDVLIRGLDDNYGHAGREYIKYLVQNIPVINGLVRRIWDELEQNATPDERFYVQGCAAVLAGACIAKKLGLLRNLDIKAMRAVCERSIKQARERREGIASVNPVERGQQALDKFLDDNFMRRGLVTEHFADSGGERRHGKDPVGDIKHSPLVANWIPPLAYHLAHRDKRLRIDKGVWQKWCGEKGVPSTALDQPGWIVKHTDSRLRLGACTNFAPPKSDRPGRTIELDLSHSDLTGYLTEYDREKIPHVPLRRIV